MSLLLSLSIIASAGLLNAPAQVKEAQTMEVSPAAPFSILIAQDPTVLAFQTERYSVRIFNRGDQLIMNVFDRQNRYIWLRDVAVVASSSPQGYIYAPISTELPAITVFQSGSEASASLSLTDRTEVATLVTVAAVPPLNGTPPTSSPDSPVKVAACWASPNAAYIYRQSDQTLLDITDRENDITWLRGVPVTATPTNEGVDYRYSGETTVDVFTSAYDGSCAIVVGEDAPEFGNQ